MPKKKLLNNFIFSVFTFLLVTLIAGFLFYYNYIFIKPLRLKVSDPVIKVSHGQGFNSILSSFNKVLYVDYPDVVNLYARIHNISRNVHVGEYRVEPNMTWESLLTLLEQGESIKHRFTLVEGWNIYNIMEALAADKNLIKTLSYDDEELFLQSIPQFNGSAEGAYMPDTYVFSYPSSDIDILNRAHTAMQINLENLYTIDNCHDLAKSPYEILIMASLLEKEAVFSDEMALISGVINNRLEQSYYLGIDASVRYGVRNFTTPLMKTELRKITPYNVYRVKGLPPTPIANPSSMALIAACNPIKTDFVYYVLKGDKRHHFSKTLAEHNRAVHKYLR